MAGPRDPRLPRAIRDEQGARHDAYRLVAWRTRTAVHCVSSTLPERQMLAIAASLRRLS